MAKLLNLGCGGHYHKDWVNIDFNCTGEGVIAYDLLKGIPFPDDTFDAVYHSHVVEHFSKNDGIFFIKECFRVLESGGIIRVVAPDLEMIIKNYQKSLEDAINGVENADLNYDWMMLELYDQTVRSFNGGEMGKYLTDPEIKNKDFVISRIGSLEEHSKPRIETMERIKKINMSNIYSKFEKAKRYFALLLVRVIFGKEISIAFKEGLFRHSGEIHRWMYDRFSLKRLLQQAGFVDINICKADESHIPDFNIYRLDVVNGKVRKPDSLFMEAIKP